MEAILSIIQNYKVLDNELDFLSQDTDTGKATSKASGLLINMEQFHTYFGLRLSYMMFATTEQLATTLQRKDITAQMCSQGSQVAIKFLEPNELRETSTLFIIPLLLNHKT